MMGASLLGHSIKAFCAMKYLKWVHLNTPPPPSSFFLIPRLWSTVTGPGKNIGSLRHYKNLGKCVYAPTIAAFRSRQDWKSVLFDQTGVEIIRGICRVLSLATRMTKTIAPLLFSCWQLHHHPPWSVSDPDLKYENPVGSLR